MNESVCGLILQASLFHNQPAHSLENWIDFIPFSCLFAITNGGQGKKVVSQLKFHVLSH